SASMERGAPWIMVPMAPSKTRMRSSRAACRASSREDMRFKLPVSRFQLLGQPRFRDEKRETGNEKQPLNLSLTGQVSRMLKKVENRLLSASGFLGFQQPPKLAGAWTRFELWRRDPMGTRTD